MRYYREVARTVSGHSRGRQRAAPAAASGTGPRYRAAPFLLFVLLTARVTSEIRLTPYPLYARQTARCSNAGRVGCLPDTAARGPEEGLRRGDHRIRIPQRTARPALPGSGQPQGDGQHDRPGGFAPRRLWRDRHGAPAGAHGFHRDQRRTADQERDCGPRRGVERNHFRRPHQLLRDGHRDRRKPEVGAGPGSGAPGQREDQQATAGCRDDRGAQRVRARRKQPAARAQRARGVHRVPLAQLRKIDHRLARRSGKGAGGATGGVLQEVLSAGQCRDRHRRQAGRNEDAAMGGRDVGADPASRAQAGPDLHGGAHAGRHAVRGIAARRRRAGSDHGVSRPGGRHTRTRRHCRCWPA